ncbi:indolepyruvate ferredoxin oxidoreductase family protein [Actinocorallia longicatena]|uniref:Indolepyruvate ferredoxin oxidoreductase family protein n=1 Tax=Actinocorallia longicatena TaxID=111803 RepID=A0ABP6Q4S8_9ACTN
MTAEILSGVDALVRLLLLRRDLDERDGLRTGTMVSGYPGSPLGGFDLALDRLGPALAENRIVHRPGLNEELAAAIVWGSQMGAVVEYDGLDGVAGAWYGKGPGLDRAGDALRHANAMGAGPGGGAVMFCGDDPSAKSSTLACDSQYTFQDACVPVLVPADQQEVLDLGVHAFRMSRYSGAWTALRIVTAVADGIGTVDLDPARHAPADPADLVVGGVPWRHRPLTTIGPHAVPDQEILVVEHRLRAARAYARHNGLDRVTGSGSGLGVVCSGKTHHDLLQALTDRGASADELGLRILKLGMVYPLDEETVLEFAASVAEILVVEEKRPFVETQLRGILHEAGSRVPVLGKRDRTGAPLVPASGELDPSGVGKILERVLPALARPAAAPRRTSLTIVSRAPGYCSGCPHNRSTLVPEGALAGGGVGCHGIMYFEARNAGLRRLPPTPMGAEGVPWLGLAPFVAEPHLIQNLGDGTLSHSGILAIRAAVAAGADLTFKVLYNAAVAMTGGQDVTGLMDVPALTRALEAEGVAGIVVCAEEPGRYGRRARWAPGVTVHGRDRLPAVQEELRKVSGVTVVIYDQRCAAEARRLRKAGLLPQPPRRVIINEAVCEGCGDCGTKSNCLSVLPVETEFGGKRRIHDSSCNRDYTCLDGDCPSFVTITPSRRGRRPRPAARPVPPSGTLPVPAVPAIDGAYGVYFTGIGGTGVVTANRVIAASARAAGLAIGGMDQTGLSQKAGAVVSHLRLAADPAALGSPAIGDAGADLYLSGDLLQAAAAPHLAKIRPGRTIAVVDGRLTPTSAMLQTGAAPLDPAVLEREITESAGKENTLFLDPKRIAEAVFADHLPANLILLGAAFQLGGLPIPLDAVETAIGAGRSAWANLEAFTWGRWAAHDPAAVEAALETAATGRSIFDPSPAALTTAADLLAAAPPPEDLHELLLRRTAQAVDYQDRARGARFLDLVARTLPHDSAEREWALTTAVAESWFKLLTYKDEYEVARLHLAADYDAMARDLGIDGRYKVTYHLHPPTLRRLGMSRKLPLGRPYELGFRLLRPLRRLRGTPFDLWGLDPDRRTERALITEYERLITTLLAEDRPYATLLEAAASAQEIKGYGPLKEAAVAAWRQRTYP